VGSDVAAGSDPLPPSGPETSINCIAAPVRDASGREVAAVSVSTDEQLLTLLPSLLPSLLAVVEAISAVTT
jgi:DNA-binding IclR family transcriptional regulator